MTHEEVLQLADLYALGALTPSETEEVEQHLESCSTCPSAMAEARESARALLFAVPQIAPPSTLYARLLRTVQSEATSAATRPVPDPAPFPVPRRRWWSGWLTAPRAAALAAAIPLVLSLWLTTQVLAMRQQLEVTESRVVANFQNGVFAADILGRVMDTGGASVPLQGTGPAALAKGKLYFTSDQQEGVLVVHGMPKLTRDKIYQLWLQRSGDNLNGGTFYCEDSGRGMLVVRSPMPLTQFEAIRVTNEPRGGSDQPQGPSYMWGRVRGA